MHTCCYAVIFSFHFSASTKFWERFILSLMAKFCSACGSPAEPGMQFCVKCGRQFPSMQAALLPGSAAAAQPRVGGEGGTRLSAAELALIQHPHGTSQVRIHLQGQYGSADDVPIRRCVSDLAVVCGCLGKSWRGRDRGGRATRESSVWCCRWKKEIAQQSSYGRDGKATTLVYSFELAFFCVHRICANLNANT